MSLVFSGSDTDKSEYTSASASIDLCPFTIWAWIYPNGLSATVGIFQQDNGTSSGFRSLTLRSTGQPNVELDMTTIDVLARSTNSGGNIVTTGKWWFVAATVSSTFVPRLYLGDLSTRVYETAYVTQTTGTGTKVSDTGGTGRWGNRTSSTSASFNGKIACGGYHNAQLSLQELISLQFNPRVISSTVNYAQLGFNGVSTQPDLSGYGQNSTVTGAVQGEHVPLGNLMGLRRAGWLGNYTAPVVSSPSIIVPQIITF